MTSTPLTFRPLNGLQAAKGIRNGDSQRGVSALCVKVNDVLHQGDPAP